MPYRGALTGIHFKFRPGTPQSSWKTSARGERKEKERERERGEGGGGRNAGERAMPCRVNCKQNKVSVSGDYDAESSGEIWRSRDCWLQESRSKRNIKYRPCALSSSFNLFPAGSLPPRRPFHFARRQELPAQYTPKPDPVLFLHVKATSHKSRAPQTRQ